MRRWCVRQVCDKRDVSQANWKMTLLLSSSAAGNSTSRCSRLRTPMLQVCGERASKKRPGNHKHMPRSVNTSSLYSCPLYLSFISLISSILFSFPPFLLFFFLTVIFYFFLFLQLLFTSRYLVYYFLFLSSRPTSGSPFIKIIWTVHLLSFSASPQSFCLH